MLRFLKSLFGRKPLEAPGVRSAEEAGDRLSDTATGGQPIETQAQPDGLPMIVPVSNSMLYQDGDFFGYPDASFYVEPEEIRPFLEKHRDQSLWYSVISGLNYDGAPMDDIIGWMLEQPDCDALSALIAYDFLEGIYSFGEDGNWPLSIIAERELAGQPFVVGLKSDYISRGQQSPEEMVEALREMKQDVEEEDAEEPYLHIPEQTLLSAGKGAVPLEKYCVDEEGVLVVSKDDAQAG